VAAHISSQNSGIAASVAEASKKTVKVSLPKLRLLPMYVEEESSQTIVTSSRFLRCKSAQVTIDLRLLNWIDTFWNSSNLCVVSCADICVTPISLCLTCFILSHAVLLQEHGWRSSVSSRDGEKEKERQQERADTERQRQRQRQREEEQERERERQMGWVRNQENIAPDGGYNWKQPGLEPSSICRSQYVKWEFCFVIVRFNLLILFFGLFPFFFHVQWL